jgi:hypothetical protein
MSIAQHAPGLDRPREYGARSVFGCDIWFDWPRFGDRCFGIVESCDRPVNGVELIRQFPTFLCKHASYVIRFDHCHPVAGLSRQEWQLRLRMGRLRPFRVSIL